jgi:hypothetical protein
MMRSLVVTGLIVWREKDDSVSIKEGSPPIAEKYMIQTMKSLNFSTGPKIQVNFRLTTNSTHPFS